MRKLGLLLAILCSLSACESVLQAEGYVYDKDTGKPIEGVRVVNGDLDDARHYKTFARSDSNGHFTAGMLIGCGFMPCKETFEITLVKDHYRITPVTMKAGSATSVALEKDDKKKPPYFNTDILATQPDDK